MSQFISNSSTSIIHCRMCTFRNNQVQTHCDLMTTIEYHRSGTRPTIGISIKFKIRSKFGVLWFKMGSPNHNKIFNYSQQCYCPVVYKISLWSAEYVMNKSITKIHWISNSIKITLGDGRQVYHWPDQFMASCLYVICWPKHMMPYGRSRPQVELLSNL